MPLATQPPPPDTTSGSQTAASQSPNPPNPRSRGHATDEDDDPYTARIRATGCYEHNERLLLCYADQGRDWRACRAEMAAFRECMKAWTERQAAEGE
ncbi:hypothetical protein M427DRAFT_50974 [Gonapodya prolifera JEL478]|uniref:CHCH domain-containing protein n=1 Tax=Gonapodya prolifera (strain JEL478) TaxID=1344416 RepID=A0A139AXT1_GONPJ|nr:hypothetical protein M427DRAFT_50974 [Gonapodya prolifera JEL478]|eukprot:KXS21548.1 hypothetical protein M427DRAFT_50974 [Gonapodya prolifera JEL478]